MYLDKRYQIAQEFCGYPEPRWVVRFLGQWIGQSASYQQAQDLAQIHNANRI